MPIRSGTLGSIFSIIHGVIWMSELHRYARGQSHASNSTTSDFSGLTGRGGWLVILEKECLRFPHDDCICGRFPVKFVVAGKIRSIGISNFTVEATKKLLETAKLPLAAKQIEAHLHLLQIELFKFLKNNVSQFPLLPSWVFSWMSSWTSILMKSWIEHSARGVQSARKQHLRSSAVC